MKRAPSTELIFPATWSEKSVATHQRLADMGKLTQVDIDEIEARLMWFREWRDYYATTGGKDAELKKASGE